MENFEEKNKNENEKTDIIEVYTNKNEEDIAKLDAPEDELPDVLRLTIKNLDTGEQFIIGENDPDFDFDTFELRRGVEATPIIDDGTKISNQSPTEAEEEKAQAKTERISWWRQLLNIIYGSQDSKMKDIQSKLETEESMQAQKSKTPFTKLSNFKFRKELGRGAFGRVLLAESKIDGSLFALKIITKKNMRSSDKRQAKAERDILHAMTLKAPHPFTSGLKFAFQSENNLYLGMDFIPGGNLRELIKKFKFLPEDWVRFYAAELVLAISHLHSMNVLYRDIKPHNVMIDGRGHAILIDFGLSKQEIVHPRGALSLVGTPDYSAPEVLKTGVQQIEQHNRERAAKGKAISSSKSNKLPPKIGYGKAADWWSLGIMIYEMLSGTPTFRGSDLRQTYQKILYADLEFSPEERFSMSARLLLAGLIKRDPSTRLGAWENPPQDIMLSSFFNGIQWDAIYERQTDGPYIPETVNFSSKKSSNNMKNSSNDVTKIVKPNFKNQIGGDHQKHNNNNTRDKNKSIESDDNDDSGSELHGMRDSVFIQPHDGGGNNLLDWSFIDEKVLVASVKEVEDNATANKITNTTVVNHTNTISTTEVVVLKEDVAENSIKLAEVVVDVVEKNPSTEVTDATIVNINDNQDTNDIVVDVNNTKINEVTTITTITEQPMMPNNEITSSIATCAVIDTTLSPEITDIDDSPNNTLLLHSNNT